MQWKFIEKLLDKNSITKVEERFGIVFPEEFKSVIIKYNYGTAEPDTFDTEKLKGKAFGELLNFNLNGKNDIIENYSWIVNKLPKKVFPFAVGAGGDYLCYDYRTNSTRPKFVFWDHEQISKIEDDELIIPDHDNEYEYYRLEFVVNSFGELLDMLYSDGYENNESSKIEEVIWENFMNEEKLKGLSDENLKAVNLRREKRGLPPILK